MEFWLKKGVSGIQIRSVEHILNVRGCLAVTDLDRRFPLVGGLGRGGFGLTPIGAAVRPSLGDGDNIGVDGQSYLAPLVKGRLTLGSNSGFHLAHPMCLPSLEHQPHGRVEEPDPSIQR